MWKFDEVLAKTILHSFFETRCRTSMMCLAADLCIAELLLTYCTVGGNGCSHVSGNLDVFVPRNTATKSLEIPGALKTEARE